MTDIFSRMPPPPAAGSDEVLTAGELPRAIYVLTPDQSDGSGVGPLGVEDAAGGLIRYVTRLELAVDAADMVMTGFMTRLSQDRPGTDPRGGHTLLADPTLPFRSVREPVMVVGFKSPAARVFKSPPAARRQRAVEV